MDDKILDGIKGWFASYCATFKTDDGAAQKNYTLKEVHTHHVCRDIGLVTSDTGIPYEMRLRAEASAILHDVGRFEQFARYKTFEDRKSENHGLLGYNIIVDRGVLNPLSDAESYSILEAVKYHNAVTIPNLGDDDAILLLRLLRDADKLDIWRVFIEFFGLPQDERASAPGLGLSDNSGYSTDAVECILNKRPVYLASLRSQNDIKLMQLSWFIDINFTMTFKLLDERGYLDKIISLLPQDKEILRLRDYLHNYIRERIANG